MCSRRRRRSRDGKERVAVCPHFSLLAGPHPRSLSLGGALRALHSVASLGPQALYCGGKSLLQLVYSIFQAPFMLRTMNRNLPRSGTVPFIIE
jgi:hypothetical protein